MFFFLFTCRYWKYTANDIPTRRHRKPRNSRIGLAKTHKARDTSHFPLFFPTKLNELVSFACRRGNSRLYDRSRAGSCRGQWERTCVRSQIYGVRVYTHGLWNLLLNRSRWLSTHVELYGWFLCVLFRDGGVSLLRSEVFVMWLGSYSLDILIGTDRLS